MTGDIMELDYTIGRSAVKVNARLLEAYDAGKLFLDELFENILDHTFAADDKYWKESILVMPASMRCAFLKFVRSYLKAEDFMPHPGVILPPPSTPEKIEAAKIRRRPRYIRLFQLIEEICHHQPSDPINMTFANRSTNEACDEEKR